MDKNYKKHNKMTKTLKWKQKTETNKIVLNILIKTIISVIKTKQKNTGPLLLLNNNVVIVKGVIGCPFSTSWYDSLWS